MQQYSTYRHGSKDLNKHFTNKVIQVVIENTISLFITREMQIKTMLTYPYKLPRMTKV